MVNCKLANVSFSPDISRINYENCIMSRLPLIHFLFQNAYITYNNLSKNRTEKKLVKKRCLM